MKQEEFKRYLKEVKGYAESTATERANCCRTIEKKFSVDLDIVASDSTMKDSLRKKVSGIKKSNVRKLELALDAYYDFVAKSTQQYVSMNGGHFYRLSDDMPPDIYFDILLDLEREYEGILGFVRGLFGSNINHNNRIPVIFSPEIKKKYYKADKIYWSKKINELIKKKHDDVNEKEILDILKIKRFGVDLLGEFCATPQPYIVLYYNVIGGMTREEKIANCVQVLAHEYMHYLEYEYCISKSVNFYQNEFLSEAMADFFGVMYLIRRGKTETKEVAKERYDSWVRWFGTSWPYAQALYFYTVNAQRMDYSDDYADYEKHGSIDKLIKVFNSCYDAEYAYTILKNM